MTDSRDSMKIIFVLAPHSITATGGFRIIAGYADRLQARGHQVKLMAPAGVPRKARRLRTRIRNFIRNLFTPFPKFDKAPFLTHPDIQVIVVPKKNEITPDDIGEADALIATWWETAEWIMKAPETVAKLHLVQGYEVFPYLPVERARAAYQLPIKKIVVSQWLQNIVREKTGADSVIIENAVDSSIFQKGERAKAPRPTIGFVYSLAQVKNSVMAINVCQNLKKEFPDLRVIAFGSHKPRISDKMPSWVEYTTHPAEDEISAIYTACNAWLFTSDEEGFGLPILEAMAAGTPVVATPAGAAPQIINGENGVLTKHDTQDATAKAANLLRLDREAWKRMSQNAAETAQKYNWQSATDRFEKIIKEHVAATKR